MPQAEPPSSPTGLCQCGCGQPTTLAKQTDTKRGLVAGQPRRFVRGHHWAGYRQTLGIPNPSGLCLCGCGEPAPISRYTSVSDQTVSGQHVRFISGHSGAKYRDRPEGQRWCRPCGAWLAVDLFYGKSDRPDGMCKVHHRQYNQTADRQEAQKNKRLRQYRLTVEDYTEMAAHQKNRCAICNRPETRTHQSGRVKQLAVDHDHGTGEVRALLCQGCNQGIGAFDDDIPRLQAAIRYLKKHR